MAYKIDMFRFLYFSHLYTSQTPIKYIFFESPDIGQSDRAQYKVIICITVTWQAFCLRFRKSVFPPSSKQAARFPVEICALTSPCNILQIRVCDFLSESPFKLYGATMFFPCLHLCLKHSRAHNEKTKACKGNPRHGFEGYCQGLSMHKFQPEILQPVR